MADYIKKIEVVVDGESAYDVRLKINQAITGANDAFENINNMYTECTNSVDACQQAVQEIQNAQEMLDEYVEESIKPEVQEYFNSNVKQGADDLATIQVRRNVPEKTTGGYLPKFWYKVVRTGPFVLYAVLSSPETKAPHLSDLNLVRSSGWEMTDNSWVIEGTAKYNPETNPANIDVLKLVLTLEDGCFIKILDPETGVFYTDYTGLQPKYNEQTKIISWDLSVGAKVEGENTASWDNVPKSISVSGITVVDGEGASAQAQTFGVSITLSAKEQTL